MKKIQFNLAAKVFMQFAMSGVILFGCFIADAQKAPANAFFSLVNVGHKTKHQVLYTEGWAMVFYGADTLMGNAECNGNTVLLKHQGDSVQQKFIMADENLKGMQLFIDSSILSFVKMENSTKLHRLLFDAYGLKIYDDVLSSKIDPDNINYSELLFAFNGKTYPAVTFWTTSTKRSMIEILNNIFRLSLQPKDFKNKEAVMAALLSYDHRIFSPKN
ncbi:hypothetical protein [Flavisolibacter ginsenosidimutans]|jgi:hypothetical protein|uniref:DUF4369 domain-containing protein n=1 Tax=Flavisolibacter ginsenosidimutans TaxID=661481 RepID=A0A5B8UIV4_9BACT|nr:hypothetical protein [Flavisolibacter ginsenosidimutans]QEC56604.1 hypothetical protein FSB75_12105 [Flavisolibacter ginsenosidimutans]